MWKFNSNFLYFLTFQAPFRNQEDDYDDYDDDDDYENDEGEDDNDDDEMEDESEAETTYRDAVKQKTKSKYAGINLKTVSLEIQKFQYHFI